MEAAGSSSTIGRDEENTQRSNADGTLPDRQGVAADTS
ncbi:hypothetical protein XaFJ1_GM003153 [Xanthomonas albilineans]|nr:hypothetical protein XaFJ1_GM003153 [Xanthomonas albilineans]